MNQDDQRYLTLSLFLVTPHLCINICVGDLIIPWPCNLFAAMRYLHFEAKYKPVAHRSLTPTSGELIQIS